jgi:hypothetical protein
MMQIAKSYCRGISLSMPMLIAARRNEICEIISITLGKYGEPEVILTIEQT